LDHSKNEDYTFFFEVHEGGGAPTHRAVGQWEPRGSSKNVLCS